MAKTKISQFDATASNNTDINSVNVAEGCPPSGINNAIREMASLLKKQEVGTDAMTSPDINGGTIDGATIGGSSGVTIGVSDGTVSAPSIKFTSDTNTGIYRGGTDILKFVTAGTDAITINASQNVGIGTSSPNAKLTSRTTDGGSAFSIHRDFSGDVGGSETGTGSFNFTLTDTATSDQIVSRINSVAVAGTGNAFAGSMRFFTAGNNGSIAEALRIDSSGNIGFGKTSYGSISTDGFWWESASNYLALSANGTSPIYMNRNGSDGGLINFYKSGSTVGSIGTNGGILYIGSPEGTDAFLGFGNNIIRPVTSAGASRDNAIDLGYTGMRFKDLYLSGSVLTSNIYGQNDGNTGIQFEGSDLITIHTGGSERLRITSGGDVLVGTNSNTLNSLHFVHSSGGQHAMGSRVGTNGNFALGVLNSSGTVVGGVVANASSTAYNTSSDHRLKENVTADWEATTRLKQLNPVRFNFIADADTTVDGFLAHEVQSVVPEAINGTHNEVDADGNPVYQGIDQSKLVPLLVKTIQELEARITALENGE